MKKKISRQHEYTVIRDVSSSEENYSRDTYSMREVRQDPIYFCGDIHGNIKHIVWKIVEQYKIDNATVIILGDFGVGFSRRPSLSLDAMYNSVKNKLEKANVVLMTIRGNHDDPGFFRTDRAFDYPYLKFIPDHIPFEVSGKIIYPIGGGTSLDKLLRLHEDEVNKKYGSSAVSYWELERPIMSSVFNIPRPIDIVISHDAPIQIGPVSIRPNWDCITDEIWDSAVKDREYLGEVLREVMPNYWLFGHHHSSTQGIYCRTNWYGLDIDEIKMIL